MLGRPYCSDTRPPVLAVFLRHLFATLPAHLVPYAVPSTPRPSLPQALELARFHADTCARLEEHAAFVTKRLRAVPGLRVVPPQGAMYIMFGLEAGAFAGLDGSADADDVVFTQRLLAEENVLMLPGSVSAP
jgi:aspartate/methionine/tyrosine aminotransferase